MSNSVGDFLNKALYDWEAQHAQELHRIASKAYEDPQSAIRLIRKVGLDSTEIAVGQSSQNFWSQALDLAARSNKLRQLVIEMRKDRSIEAYWEQIERVCGRECADVVEPTLGKQPDGGVIPTPARSRWVPLSVALAGSLIGTLVATREHWLEPSAAYLTVSGEVLSIQQSELERTCGQRTFTLRYGDASFYKKEGTYEAYRPEVGSPKAVVLTCEDREFRGKVPAGRANIDRVELNRLPGAK